MTAPDRLVRVYVDGRGVDVPAARAAADAVRAADPAAAEALLAGRRTLTDSRGLPLAADAPAYAGAIFRLVGVRSGPPRPGAAPDSADPPP